MVLDLRDRKDETLMCECVCVSMQSEIRKILIWILFQTPQGHHWNRRQFRYYCKENSDTRMISPCIAYHIIFSDIMLYYIWCGTRLKGFIVKIGSIISKPCWRPSRWLQRPRNVNTGTLVHLSNARVQQKISWYFPRSSALSSQWDGARCWVIVCAAHFAIL